MILRLFLALWLAISPVSAGSNLSLIGVGAPSATAGCTEATTWLARITVDATHQAAYTVLICGMVSDGTFATLDVLQVYATQNSTAALLNIISTSFAASAVGGPTFTADSGYVGNGATSYVDTGYDPTTAAIHYTLNSAQVSAWSLTAGASDAGYLIGVVETGGAFNSIRLSSNRFNGGSGLNEVQSILNNSTAFYSGVPASTAGFFTASRTGATAIQNFYNGASMATDTASSNGIPVGGNIYACALNFGNAPSSATTENVAIFAAGSGMNPTQAAAFYSRIHTYMQTIAGVP